MSQLSANLYHLPIRQLCKLVKQHFPAHEYHFKKHTIVLKDADLNPLGSIRLPLHFSLNEYLTIITDQAQVLYVSVESGYATISMMQGVENVYHTSFGAYMTRKKQGFSQIKYLKKKGKSRAGSRVRLAETIEFFEKINLTLTKLLETYTVDRLALNCNTTLIPYLYQSKVKCPFEKNDRRLYRIPVHIPQSNFTHLEAAIKKLKAPILFYEEPNKPLMEPLTAGGG
ncbi:MULTISPECIES: hypothetical protein [unclassified Imperialibacter]|uniref:hypothetical protein n=1 Tax=unclassified Imperialibacter TaxID=2629706 RepID=UPI00125C8896|nr:MULTISPECIES: hypothetical protein [unclassified Imperialibacter]CAD5277188.1 conserved hypothetical protein [Imperialibacter sp. 75]CAD5295164.1 conserved hypothetical protein [Imperialibacter sp. 89]VVT12208.1 conserved hypothetical protein [Imperialibacter sp. EC-SDR9]